MVSPTSRCRSMAICARHRSSPARKSARSSAVGRFTSESSASQQSLVEVQHPLTERSALVQGSDQLGALISSIRHAHPFPSNIVRVSAIAPTGSPCSPPRVSATLAPILNSWSS
jgi:hypothetical protein